MPRFRPEPRHQHGQPRRVGVLLINLGTPQAPSAKALRPYLREFLSDPRVVEIPRLLWWPILHGIILLTRPAKSAAKYATVWTREGSPLAVHTRKQASLVQGYFAAQGGAVPTVRWAMRYGEPSVASQLDALRAAGCDRILVLPLYPQHAGSTTGSVADALGAWLKRARNTPEFRFVRSFHRDPAYIAALAASVREHWQREGRGDKLVISFHGVPRFSLDQGDPYYCECHVSARLLAEALGLAEDQYLLSFQSRFGRAKWLEPYTQASLERLAKSGTQTVDVICPGFVADCLETLEEIAIECRDAFVAAGGKELRYIPCLNERDAWIKCLVGLVQTHAADWLATPALAPAQLERGAARAKEMGAPA